MAPTKNILPSPKNILDILRDIIPEEFEEEDVYEEGEEEFSMEVLSNDEGSVNQVEELSDEDLETIEMYLPPSVSCQPEEDELSDTDSDSLEFYHSLMMTSPYPIHFLEEVLVHNLIDSETPRSSRYNLTTDGTQRLCQVRRRLFPSEDTSENESD